MRQQGKSEETGTAKITRAYHLPARFVLHTVGPVYNSGNDVLMSQLLTSCYHSCLETAAQVGSIRSIGFCSISTGVFGFPAERAAGIALNAVDEWLSVHPERFSHIVFNVFSEKDYRIYHGLLNG
jgi:O-acetyl-ADP-ribose deacetylase (regulator of RNase III)